MLVGWPAVAPAFAQLRRKHLKSERQDHLTTCKNNSWAYICLHQKSGLDSKK